MKTPNSKTQVFQQSIESAIKAQCSASLAILRRFAVLLAAVILTACSARASTNNLLVNPTFNNGLAGWSTFTFGGGWATAEVPSALVGTTPTNWPSGAGRWPGGAGTNSAGTGPLYDGSLQLSVGGSSGGSGFCRQDVAAAPGVQYTLTVQGGAQNWWLPTGEIRLFFLDVNSVGLATNVVRTTDSLHNASNGGLGDKYDVGVPYQMWTNVATAPVGTKYIRVELCNPNGIGTAWFDNPYLTAPNNPPVIANLYPDGSVLLQNTNKLAFTAGSASPINGSGIDVTLNGVDVTSNLVITGSGTTNVSVSYTGLQPNTIYTAVISVTDTATLSMLKNFTFDTYAASFVWEAEDYDFTNGQYFDAPVLSSTPQPGSYFGVTGVSNVDYSSSTTGLNDFRTNDTTGIGPAGDTLRQAYVTAQLTDPAVKDYDVGYIANGNWFDYTRDYPAGTYNIYGRLAGGQGATTVSLDDVTGGITNNLGVFSFNGSDWGAWRYIPLVDTYGNLLTFTFNAKRTLRATLTSGGVNMNFFMLVPAVPGLPLLSNISPANGTVFGANTALNFTAASSAGLNASGIQVLLNGIDVSSNLVISGSTTNKNVSYPLQPNVIYTAVINVTNTAGVGVSRTVNFDTFSQNNFMIEAEDFDFNGGQFIDNPIPTGAYVNNAYPAYAYSAPDSYFFYPAGDSANAAIVGVDLTTVLTDAGETFIYRPAESAGTQVATDFLRQKFYVTNGATVTIFNDFNLGWWDPGQWVNYTRTFPTNMYYVYGRLASGGAYSGLTLSLVTNGVGTATQTTKLLGSFSDPNANGYQSWHWVPLLNTNGNLVTASLGGVETIQAQTGAVGVNANFYMFVPAVVGPQAVHLSVSRTGNTISIQFPTQSGFSYTVLYSGSLAPANWQTLTTITGDGSAKTATDTISASQRFYRVSVQ